MLKDFKSFLIKNQLAHFFFKIFFSFLSRYLCFSLKNFPNFSLKPLFFPSSYFFSSHPNPQRFLGIFSPRFSQFPFCSVFSQDSFFLPPPSQFPFKNLSDFLSQHLHHTIFLLLQLWKSTPSALEPPTHLVLLFPRWAAAPRNFNMPYSPRIHMDSMWVTISPQNGPNRT